MSFDWKTKPLGEVASNVSRRFNFKGKDKVVFINTGDVLEGAFLHSNYSDTKDLPGQAKKAIEKGDILYSEIRPGNKRYVLVDFDPKDYVVSTKFMVIKSTEEILPEFLYLILTSRDCEQEFKIIADSRSGTFPQVTFDSISYFPINYPDKTEQERILQVTDSLSGKLAVNAKRNQTLEQIAQAIFKSWFVDFDPVKAKIETLAAGGSAEDAELAAMSVISAKTIDELNSLKNNNPEAFNKLAQTAALFPAAMQDSELGEIPEGWEISKLSSLIQLTGGGTPKRSEETYWNGDIPWFSVRDVPSGSNVFVVDTDEKITELGLRKSSTKLLPKGTTIITARGTVGKLALVGTDMCMNQSCYGIRGKDVGDFYNYFNLKEAVSTLQRNTHGAVFDTITTTTFDTYSMAFSGLELANKFDALIAPLLQGIEANVRQSIELSTLRNTLLPKLLSGEVDLTSEVIA